MSNFAEAKVRRVSVPSWLSELRSSSFSEIVSVEVLICIIDYSFCFHLFIQVSGKREPGEPLFSLIQISTSVMKKKTWKVFSLLALQTSNFNDDCLCKKARALLFLSGNSFYPFVNAQTLPILFLLFVTSQSREREKRVYLFSSSFVSIITGRTDVSMLFFYCDQWRLYKKKDEKDQAVFAQAT